MNRNIPVIAAAFISVLPLLGWSEAPVVDDSEHFAIIDEQQVQEAPVLTSQNENYKNRYSEFDEGPALAQDDQPSDSADEGMSNARLIATIQSLQKEVQELRGQLEVQAHDLKVLQQQQIAFYKDLDSRLAGHSSLKMLANKTPINHPTDYKAPAVAPEAAAIITNSASTVSVSRENPADEQISYLAAYELVKSKRYDEALTAMNLFVQKYPKGGYTANAQYWLGELYLVKRDYAKAVAHFDVVLQQFPTSTKSAASMLKTGYAYAAQGKKQEAKKFLQQVLRAYPGTPTAQLASTKLSSI